MITRGWMGRIGARVALGAVATLLASLIGVYAGHNSVVREMGHDIPFTVSPDLLFKTLTSSLAVGLFFGVRYHIKNRREGYIDGPTTGKVVASFVTIWLTAAAVASLIYSTAPSATAFNRLSPNEHTCLVWNTPRAAYSWEKCQ
jgi:hypothetical protein